MAGSAASMSAAALPTFKEGLRGRVRGLARRLLIRALNHDPRITRIGSACLGFEGGCDIVRDRYEGNTVGDFDGPNLITLNATASTCLGQKSPRRCATAFAPRHKEARIGFLRRSNRRIVFATATTTTAISVGRRSAATLEVVAGVARRTMSWAITIRSTAAVASALTIVSTLRTTLLRRIKALYLHRLAFAVRLSEVEQRGDHLDRIMILKQSLRVHHLRLFRRMRSERVMKRLARALAQRLLHLVGSRHGLEGQIHLRRTKHALNTVLISRRHEEDAASG